MTARHCEHWMYGGVCCRCQSIDDNPDGECDLADDEQPEPCPLDKP